jgi:protease-4
VAVADTFGDGGAANAAYCLATACREVVVHPGGHVGFLPLSLEHDYYRGLLDRAGVEVEVFAREEYKSAASRLTERELAGPDREQLQRVLDSLWESQVSYIARDRALPEADVREAAEQGPLTAAEALGRGLVDRVAYTDQVVESAKASAGRDAKLLYLSEYRKRTGRGRTRGRAAPVALVHAAGEIHRSWALPFGALSAQLVAADSFIPVLKAVERDKRARAVVVRVDSPGGSSAASASIWRQLGHLRETGKPVVVSMGPVAASGGYYIALPADRVLAQPGTITGSIGVISADLALSGAKAKLGITTGEVHTGEEPSGFSVNRRLSEHQRRRQELLVDATYEEFLQRVSTGRRMPLDRARELARGRVWTGADALERGLVDELGGLQRALEVAVELSGAPPGTRPRVRQYPRKRGLLAGLVRRPPASSDDVGAPSPASPLGVTGLAQALASERLAAHMGCRPSRYWVP